MLENNKDYLSFCDNNLSSANDDDDNGQKNNSTKKKYYLCCCPPHYIPTFEIGDKKIKLNCPCERNKDISYEEIIKLLVQELDEIIDISHYYLCQKQEHRNKKFKYFCKTCKEHLCSLCLKLTNAHKEHDLVIFYNTINETKKLASQIKNKLYTFNNVNSNLKELFNIIYDNFLTYPNHYSYILIIQEYNKYLNLLNHR
jgi:hypothetical protein